MEQVLSPVNGDAQEVQAVITTTQSSMEKPRQVTDIELGMINVSKTNGIFRRKHELTKEALSELAISISNHGVIQPILVRPHKEITNCYELISGERRYRASEIAGKTHIPAYVVEVTDAVALILQITENIQRENVHPLNEAKGYKLMMEADPTLGTSELALRFGKSETYIIQRLKLNDLVRDAKKDFYENRMHLGHAILMCRLLPADQKEIVSRYNNKEGYGTVNDLESYIRRNVMNSLSTAPFDKKDEELYKKAGSCLACPKRSGASPLLFAEIKQKDQCFDRGCFFAKCDLFLLARVRKAIETEPEVVFLSEGYDDPNEKVIKMLDEHKIKPLKQYNEFHTHDSGGTKVKGLWICGDNAGHIAEVFLRKETKTIPAGAEGIPVQIEKIKHRMQRGRELDREKVYARILEALLSHPSQKKTFNEKMIRDEEVMLWYIVFDKGGWKLKDELLNVLGVRKHEPEKIYNALKTMKAEDKALMLRRVMMDQYGGNSPDSNHGYIIHKIAAGYGDIDIVGFQKEQTAIAEKRETRAGERIAELRRTAKGLDEAKKLDAKLAEKKPKKS